MIDLVISFSNDVEHFIYSDDETSRWKKLEPYSGWMKTLKSLVILGNQTDHRLALMLIHD